MLTPFPGNKLFDIVKKDGQLGDMGEFLQKNCDAYDDIPLNISGQTDQDLLMLKKGLEEKVNLVIAEAMNHLYNLLFDMRSESKQSHAASKR